MQKKAFVTGVTGQDGAWLSKYLIDLGYEVYGGVRRSSSRNLSNLEYLGIKDKLKLVEFDLLEYSNIYETVKELKPDEFYNLAAQSFVGTSFKQPISTNLVDGMSVAYILDILHTISPETRFYQASTSEMFGKVQQIPQTESTPFYPRSPYGCAKLYAHWLTINYRESYNMFATCGILFNHESELRGPEFVTRKITMNVARRSIGEKEILELGNLDSERDWGYAKEYVEGMYKILHHDKPETYVLATGVTTKIRTFVEMAFKVIGKEIRWEGKEDKEIGYDLKTNEVLVRVNPKFYRPSEVDLLIGSAKKAKDELGWEAKVNIEKLAEIMVGHDIDLLK